MRTSGLSNAQAASQYQAALLNKGKQVAQQDGEAAVALIEGASRVQPKRATSGTLGRNVNVKA